MISKFVLNVVVESSDWIESVDFDALKVAEEVKELTFEYVEEAVKHELLGVKKTYVINLALSNDEEVHKLNREFRGIDKPTNVLSFANIDDDAFWDALDDEPEQELGDIILAFETLQKEAALKNISIYAHFCHLLVHGYLHLLGFDHQDDKEADEMEGLEVDILEQFSIENPYTESDMEE